MYRGATVIAILRDGEVVIDKYIEAKDRFVLLRGRKIRTDELRSLGYYKGNSTGDDAK